MEPLLGIDDKVADSQTKPSEASPFPPDVNTPHQQARYLFVKSAIHRMIFIVFLGTAVQYVSMALQNHYIVHTFYATKTDVSYIHGAGYIAGMITSIASGHIAQTSGFDKMITFTLIFSVLGWSFTCWGSTLVVFGIGQVLAYSHVPYMGLGQIGLLTLYESPETVRTLTTKAELATSLARLSIGVGGIAYKYVAMEAPFFISLIVALFSLGFAGWFLLGDYESFVRLFGVPNNEHIEYVPVDREEGETRSPWMIAQLVLMLCLSTMNSGMLAVYMWFWVLLSEEQIGQDTAISTTQISLALGVSITTSLIAIKTGFGGLPNISVLVVVYAMACLAFVILDVYWTSWYAWIFSCVFMIARGCYAPITLTMIVDTSDPDIVGVVNGWYAAARNVGQSLVPIIFATCGISFGLLGFYICIGCEICVLLLMITERFKNNEKSLET